MSAANNVVRISSYLFLTLIHIFPEYFSRALEGCRLWAQYPGDNFPVRKHFQKSRGHLFSRRGLIKTIGILIGFIFSRTNYFLVFSFEISFVFFLLSKEYCETVLGIVIGSSRNVSLVMFFDSAQIPFYKLHFRSFPQKPSPYKAFWYMSRHFTVWNAK